MLEGYIILGGSRLLGDSKISGGSKNFEGSHFSFLFFFNLENDIQELRKAPKYWKAIKLSEAPHFWDAQKFWKAKITVKSQLPNLTFSKSHMFGTKWRMIF